jgi:hypothetical protein
VFTGRIIRLRLIVATGSALIAIGAFASACGNNGGQTTTTTTTTTTSSNSTPPSPTEKGINPTGGNLFTPGNTANPAPNVSPGQHPGINNVP